METEPSQTVIASVTPDFTTPYNNEGAFGVCLNIILITFFV